MLLLNTVPNAPSISSPIFTDNPGRLLEEHMHDINVNNFAKCVFSQRGFSVWKILFWKMEQASGNTKISHRKEFIEPSLLQLGRQGKTKLDILQLEAYS